jgi:hypothetical protein
MNGAPRALMMPLRHRVIHAIAYLLKLEVHDELSVLESLPRICPPRVFAGGEECAGRLDCRVRQMLCARQGARKSFGRWQMIRAIQEFLTFAIFVGCIIVVLIVGGAA